MFLLTAVLLKGIFCLKIINFLFYRFYILNGKSKLDFKRISLDIFFFFLTFIVMLCSFLPYNSTNQPYFYIYIPSFWSLPPFPPSYPSGSSQSTRLGPRCSTAASHQLLLYTRCCTYINATSSIGPTLSFLHCGPKSTLSCTGSLLLCAGSL